MNKIYTAALKAIETLIAYSKKNWVVLVSIFLVAFFFGSRGCGGNEGPAKVQIDETVVKKVMAENKILKAFQDSANKALQTQKQEIARTNRQRDSLTRLARNEAKNASYWHTKFKQAKEVNDTPTQVVACDSALESYQIAVQGYEAGLQKADSAITNMAESMALLEEVKNRQAERIDVMSKVIVQQNEESKKLQQANTALQKKLKSKKFWRGLGDGLKVGGAAVAGFFIGNQLK